MRLTCTWCTWAATLWVMSQKVMWLSILFDRKNMNKYWWELTASARRPGCLERPRCRRMPTVWIPSLGWRCDWRHPDIPRRSGLRGSSERSAWRWSRRQLGSGPGSRSLGSAPRSPRRFEYGPKMIIGLKHFLEIVKKKVAYLVIWSFHAFSRGSPGLWSVLRGSATPAM